MFYVDKSQAADLFATLHRESSAAFFIFRLVLDSNKFKSYLYNVSPVTVGRVDKISLTSVQTDIEKGEYTYQFFEANDGSDLDITGKKLIETGKLRIQ